MPSEYAESLRWLYELAPRGMRLGLERMRRGLRLRGNPEHSFRVVQVAGTNGKGSTSAMLERALRAQGLRTGLYTSPHLHSFTERIRISGEPISCEEVVERVQQLKEFLEEPETPWLTFFEVSLIMACEAFRDARADVVILEVGLGGRLDATTAAESDLAVVTEVALDHTHRLGDTVRAIAREKAGIIRPGCPVVISAGSPEARQVVGRRARDLGSPRYYRGREFGWNQADPPVLRLGQRELHNVRMGLAGDHQRGNAAAAGMAATLLCPEISEHALREGIGDVEWPGRLERVAGDPPFVFDAAHNPDGCCRLAEFLGESVVEGPRVLIFGAMQDKDLSAMLGALDPVIQKRVYVAPEMDRACEVKELARLRPGYCAPNFEDAIAEARRCAGPRGEVVVAGSVFVLAEVRARILGITTDPPLGL